MPGNPGIIYGTNGWELLLTVKGRVTSIGAGVPPQMPAEVVGAIRK